MTNELDILQALRTLPVAVCITPRPNGYTWQCLDTSGTSPTLAAAMSEGLTYLTHTLASDALVIDDLLVATTTSRSMMN